MSTRKISYAPTPQWELLVQPKGTPLHAPRWRSLGRFKGATALEDAESERDRRASLPEHAGDMFVIADLVGL